MPRFRNPVVSTADLADGSVTTPKLAAGAVTSAKIATNLQSDNYDGGAVVTNPGTVGWRIERNTGNAVFRTLVAADASGRRLEIRGDDTESEIKWIDTNGNTAAGIDLLAGEILTLENKLSGAKLAFEGQTQGITATAEDDFTVSLGNLVIDAGPAFTGGRLVINDQSNPPSAADLTIKLGANFDQGFWPINAFRLGVGVGGFEVGEFFRFSSGNEGLRLPGGTEARPSLAGISEVDGGMSWASNQIQLSAGGVYQAIFRSADTRMPGINLTTTGAAGNVFINSTTGLMARSTSSSRYKVAIRPWDHRHDVLELSPRLYRSRSRADDRRRVRLGLIAEEVADVFPIAAMVDDEGRPDAIDWNMITTGLLAAVQRLEARVAALEAA